MPAKRRQHYVPRIYLKPWIDDTPPDNWPPNRPFTPTVWVVDKSLAGEPRRKPPEKILWENYLYNLASDDPDRPFIEEALSRLESAFAPVQSAVLGHEDLTIEQYGVLCLFVGALFGRTPSHMDHWQKQLDNIERIYRQMASADVADEFWAGSAEAGKKFVLPHAMSYAEVVAPTSFLLVNESTMPFITSDHPVAHVFRHIDDAPIKYFDNDRLAPIRNNTEAFLSFAALSPSIAFVSSPLLVRTPYLYSQTWNPELVFALNQLTRQRADNVIVSRVPRPYGDLTDAVRHAETQLAQNQTPRTGLVVYTDRGRYWISCTEISHEMGEHPLHGRIRFRTPDTAPLRRIADDMTVEEVRIVRDGGNFGGMREAWVACVALTSEGDSLIENWPGGWRTWIEHAET